MAKITLTGKHYADLLFNPYKQPVVTLKQWVEDQIDIATGIFFNSKKYFGRYKPYPYGISYTKWVYYKFKLSKHK